MYRQSFRVAHRANTTAPTAGSQSVQRRAFRYSHFGRICYSMAMRADEGENPVIRDFFQQYYTDFSAYSAKRRQDGWPLAFAEYLAAEQLQRALYRTLVQHLQLPTLVHRTILDVGCGDGHKLRWFLDWGAPADHLFGIDSSELIIAEARRLSAPQMRFQQGMGSDLPFPDQHFDLLTSFGVLIHIMEDATIRAMSTEFRRVCKPNGALIVTVYNENMTRAYDPWMGQRTRGFNRAAQQLEALFPEWRCQWRDDSLNSTWGPLLDFVARQSQLPTDVQSRLKDRANDDAVVLDGTWDLDLARFCRTERVGYLSLYLFRPIA